MRISALSCAVLALSVSLLSLPAFAQDAEEPPPLPLLTLEGVGGHFSVSSAWLVNPGKADEVFGLPSMGYMHVHLGHGKNLEVFQFAETLWGRLELGYGYDYLDIGDLPEDVERAFGNTVTIDDHAVELHNLNARYQIAGEGGFGLDWFPATTFGIHYKANTTVDDLDRDLGGGLDALGIEDNRGFDFTLTVTKMIDFLPWKFALTATLRRTEAAHIGLLGFTNTARFVGEFAVCGPIADNIYLAAEYRQKPSNYTTVPGLLGDEDDWWTIDACVTATKNLTVAAGYGHFGNLLNHTANRSFGISIKWEF